MVNNLFYNNEIVISAIKNNKFLISFDKEINNIKAFKNHET
jgi:hypothetical protein